MTPPESADRKPASSSLSLPVLTAIICMPLVVAAGYWSSKSQTAPVTWSTGLRGTLDGEAGSPTERTDTAQPAFPER